LKKKGPDTNGMKLPVVRGDGAETRIDQLRLHCFVAHGQNCPCRGDLLGAAVKLNSRGERSDLIAASKHRLPNQIVGQQACPDFPTYHFGALATQHRSPLPYSRPEARPAGGSGPWYNPQRRRNTMNATSTVVHSDPDILGGTPVFVGTRVPVRTLLDYLEAGDSLPEFLEDFPTVTREQAVAALELAKQILESHAHPA
jgi:uncharacterized protein (DUF433 family)